MPATATGYAALGTFLTGVVAVFLAAISIGEAQFPGMSSERRSTPAPYEVDCREVRTGVSPVPPRPANACEKQRHWVSEELIKVDPNNDKYRDVLLEVIRTCDPEDSSTWLPDYGWKQFATPPVFMALRDRVSMSDDVFEAIQQACSISGTTESYRSAASKIQRANLRYHIISAPIGFTAALSPPPPPPPPPQPRLTTVTFTLEPREARQVDLHKGGGGTARERFVTAGDGTYALTFKDADAGSWVMRVWHRGYGGQIGFCVQPGRASSVKLWLAQWGSITLDQMNNEITKLDACRGIAWAPPPAPSPQPPSQGPPLWTVDCLCKKGDRLAGYYVNSPFSSLNASTQRLINTVVRLRSNQACSIIGVCQGGSSEIGEYRARIENLDLNAANVYRLAVFGSIVP